ncbi:hypothetical protein BOTBODRAFT_171388 [Botryobasidium botryosum FD-172 SS1]|uniref:F-box domain-containing protein n=1 Tax=Botryobasidium botryosum (strain FD-172 SS1) TaxID=930990 RepID=A0A067MS45_BOTB1|nr:hypothetical protein BOTBODRAFT_171388 [Botryobasidium botryosum FD-172 SS1]
MLLATPQNPTSLIKYPNAPKRTKQLASLPCAYSPTPVSRPTSALPLEIYAYILDFADPSTLASAARVNFTFQHEAEILLYRNVRICGHKCAVTCGRSLLLAKRKHRLIALRRFQVTAACHSFHHPDLVSSIKSILNAAPNLIDLELELWGSGPLSPDEPIRLQRFTTDHDFDHNMLDFLARVPLLKTLSIVEPPQFSILDSSIVPMLESIEGTWAVVKLVVPHRPIREVIVLGQLEEEMVEILLSALEESSARIEHLGLSVSCESANVLSALAQRLPFLRTIEIQSVELIPSVRSTYVFTSKLQ